MAPRTFFEHYRISRDYDGSPIEVGRTGPAIHYKASDSRSGAEVRLTRIPVASIDPQAREHFEEQARGALHLDHINIEKVVAFGTELDQFAFVSELPQGETLEAWVAGQGPMPVDAVLRVALQVAGALSAASFYGLTHPAIQPSNLMIVPGQTVEGGWPMIKVTNFGVAGLPVDSAPPAADRAASEFASPEQAQTGKVDFRSEIYSLGATMCFLLTGAFDPVEPRSLQTKRFMRPLRNLIAPMLRQNPDERPQDPALFTQEVRSCLERVERRQGLARKFGVPFVPVMARAPKERVIEKAPEEVIAIATEAKPGSWFLRRALPIAALLIALAVAAAAFLPAPVSMILRKDDAKTIGVPVGVADSSPGTNAKALHPSTAVTAPNPAPSVNHTSAIAADANLNESPATQSVQRPSPPIAVRPSNPSTEVAANAPASGPLSPAESPGATAPQPTGPQTVWERAAGTSGQPKIARQETSQTNSADDTAATSPDSGNQLSEASKDQSVASPGPTNGATSNLRHPGASAQARSRISQSPAAGSDQGVSRSADGTVHARYIGMTPDGNLILRLPSGRTVIVPRNAARLTVPPRRRIYYPPQPPPYGPGY